jgi:3-oxoacyl-[acyl-carrier-protein] synthase-3
MRIGNGLAVKAAATWLPPESESIADVVRAGRLEEQHLARAGVSDVRVSRDLAGPEQAALAACGALEAAGWPAARVGYLVHAWLYHQGHDFWSPAHYVANRIGAVNALPFGVQHMSNGGALGLQLAATRLIAGPGVSSALVTTGDRFSLPGFDRWTSDYDVAYGDGGTALLLGYRAPEGDRLRLCSVATSASPDLEVMFRGDDEFSPAPLSHSAPISVRRSKKGFLASDGPGGTGSSWKDHLVTLGPQRVRAVLQEALDDAGLEADDPRIKVAALPRLGPWPLEIQYTNVVQEMLKAEPLQMGAHTGHLGAGDFLANIADIIALDVLDPGDYAVVLGGGGGYTWSCALLQVPEA